MADLRRNTRMGVAPHCLMSKQENSNLILATIEDIEKVLKEVAPVTEKAGTGTWGKLRSPLSETAQDNRGNRSRVQDGTSPDRSTLKV